MFVAFSEYMNFTINPIPFNQIFKNVQTITQTTQTKEKSREKVKNRCHPIMQALADLKCQGSRGNNPEPIHLFHHVSCKNFHFFLFHSFSGASNTENISPEKNGTKTDTSQGRRSTSVRPIHQLFIDDRVRRFLKIEIQFLACQLSYNYLQLHTMLQFLKNRIEMSVSIVSTKNTGKNF